MEIVFIAAVGENGEMGIDNKLLWHLEGDLPRFKQLTMGAAMIMGRKTFDSIGRALPGRLNIVLTGNREWQAEGVSVAYTIEESLELAKAYNEDRVSVIGGGEIYKLFLPYATILELTEVQDAPVADTYFPVFDSAEFIETARVSNNQHSPKFDYVTYERK